MSSQPIADDDFAPRVAPTPVPRAAWRVNEVQALPGWRLRVRHNDGVSGIVDMSGLINSPRAGVFATLREASVFEQVFLDFGAVTWPGEIDIAPDAMHDEIARNGEWILN